MDHQNSFSTGMSEALPRCLVEYLHNRSKWPGFCKKIGRQIDRYQGTTWEAFFHNREIGFHQNDYKITAGARAFIHVPRTAGTSVVDFFSRLPDARVEGLNIHRPVSRRCLPGRFRYFTILRDPVERCWSFYRLTLHGQNHVPYHEAASRGLAHFCKQCWEMRNMYCRYLSGFPWREADTEILHLAKNHLSRFEAVLSLGDLSKQIDRLCSVWSLSPSVAFQHRNRAPGPEMGLDPASREILEEHNQMDLNLYTQFRNGFIRSPENQEGSSQ